MNKKPWKVHSDTHIFKEDLENTTSLFVNETRNTFDTATTGETADGGLCDTLDVVAKNLPVTLGSTLSQSLSTLYRSISETENINFCILETYFSASRHC